MNDVSAESANVRNETDFNAVITPAAEETWKANTLAL